MKEDNKDDNWSVCNVTSRGLSLRRVKSSPDPLRLDDSFSPPIRRLSSMGRKGRPPGSKDSRPRKSKSNTRTPGRKPKRSDRVNSPAVERNLRARKTKPTKPTPGRRSGKSDAAPWEFSDSEDDGRPDFYSNSDLSSEEDFDDPSAYQNRNRYADELEMESGDPGSDFGETDSELGKEEESQSLSSQVSQEYRAPTPEWSMQYCPWVVADPDSIPELKLPPSSQDLLVPDAILLDALELYEICRRYSHIIKLSPFLFEDFCAALVSPENSGLLAEIHISFFKLLHKEDDDLKNIIFGPGDTKDSQNICLHLIDDMTYAEVLRQYLYSDCRRFPNDVREALCTGNYPFVSYEQRLVVLRWLTSRFLLSHAFRNDLKGEGKLVHDQHCRDCGKAGNLLCCDGCTASYHLECVDPPLQAMPPENVSWFCCICKIHQTKGVHDCVSLLEMRGQLIRQESLGSDRHGRKYWFLVRRIFVINEETGEPWYYSTVPQLRQLIAQLDETKWEWALCQSLNENLSDIIKQMSITSQITEASKSTLKSYLSAENEKILADIKLENADKYLSHTGKQNGVLTPGLREEQKENAFLSSHFGLKGQLLTRVDDELNGIIERKLSEPPVLEVQPAKSTRSSNCGVIGAPMMQAVDSVNRSDLYKLGLDTRIGYRKYVNQYSTNDYAKDPYIRAQQRTRNTYMEKKFSLTDEAQFQWTQLLKDPKEGCAKESVVFRVLLQGICTLVKKISPYLMHQLWRKEIMPKFSKRIEAARTLQDLKDLLALFEACLRRGIFRPSWTHSLGHTRLIRQTPLDREDRQKTEKIRMKTVKELLQADPEEPDGNIVWVKYSKLGGPPAHNIWKNKDERYRVNGKYKLGGWEFVSCNRKAQFQTPQCIPPKEHGTMVNPAELSQPERKRQRLERLVQSFRKKREDQIEVKIRGRKTQVQTNCYSPSCLSGISFRPTSGPNSTDHVCYSVVCRQRAKEAEKPGVWETKGIAKAHLVTSTGNEISVARARRISGNRRRSGSRGKESPERVRRPYPVPVVNEFLPDYVRSLKLRSSTDLQKSLLTLDRYSRRKLAKKGGITVFVPEGFAPQSKSSPIVWPYPCNRPLFYHCWRFMLQSATTYHAFALQFRILWACIKWNEVECKDSSNKESLVSVQYEAHSEIRHLVDHKEMPPFGVASQYLLKLVSQLNSNVRELSHTSLDEGESDADSQADEDYTPSRGGRTLRDRKKLKKSKAAAGLHSRELTVPKVYEKWVSEHELYSWEIRNYWARREKNPDAGKLELEKKPPPFSPLYSSSPMLKSAKTSSGTVVQLQQGPLGYAQIAPNSFQRAANLGNKAGTASPGLTFVGAKKRPNIVSKSGQPHLDVKRTNSEMISLAADFAPYTPSNSRVQISRSAGSQGTPIRAMVENVQTAQGMVRRIIVAPPPQGGTIQGQPKFVLRSGSAISPGIASKGTIIRHAQGISGARIINASHQGGITVQGQTSPSIRLLSSSAPGTTLFYKDKNGNLHQLQTQKTLATPGSSQQLLIRSSNNTGESSQLSGDASILENERMSPDLAGTSAAGLFRASMRGATQRDVFMRESPGTIIHEDDAAWHRAVGGRPPGAGPHRIKSPAMEGGTVVKFASDLVPAQGGVVTMGGPFRAGVEAASEIQTKDPSPKAVHSKGMYRIGTPSSTVPAGVRKTTIAMGGANLDYTVGKAKSYQDMQKAKAQQISTSKSADIVSPQERENRLKAQMMERSEIALQNQCAKVMEMLLTTVEHQEKEEEKESKKRWSKEYRREYERAYRQRRKEIKKLEESLLDNISKIRRESSKRRHIMEVSAEEQTGLFLGKTPDEQLPVRFGGKRKLSDRLCEPSPMAARLSESKLSETLEHSASPASMDEEDVPGPSNVSHPAKVPRLENSSVNTSMNDDEVGRPSSSSLHCYCRTPYDPKRFYVGCDLCSRWFHGSCSGVTGRKAKKINAWICRECEREQKETQQILYCLCRTPYVETEFYVGCDGCGGWFHPRCVGISQTEAEEVEDYVCPSCSSSSKKTISLSLTRADYPFLWSILESLQEHRTSWPFRDPVDRKAFPRYYQVIKEPMDLGTVQKRLESMEYHRLHDFEADVGKIFNNARLFNPPDTPIHQCAVILEKRFQEKLTEARDAMASIKDNECSSSGFVGDSVENPGVSEEDENNLLLDAEDAEYLKEVAEEDLDMAQFLH